jgi:hypothetical protein
MVGENVGGVAGSVTAGSGRRWPVGHQPLERFKARAYTSQLASILHRAASVNTVD